MAERQSFANHTKLVPAFHFFVLPALLLNLGSSIHHLVHLGFTVNSLISVITAVALVLLAFCARLFALTVQDRVIRLEERMRLEKLLPADLQPRIGEFTVAQLVGLRFASDSELPALARKVLTDKIADRKPIKQLVQNWRADNLRA
ncbi:MAG TPA: DUF6526 family protein [Candidatus Acidoferrum sp.]|jgi:hypothetical protein